jgi:glycosyltransferase involved in cell wall biosynthesis
MGVECIDANFSTTRRMTRVWRGASNCGDHTINGPKRSFVRADCEGGLRAKGLFKSSEDIPLISVVTVTFNSGPELEQTIASVLSQRYSNIEYIIIDGGSTDGTLDIIKKYDHAIDYWISEPDRGIYDAMNKGIRTSTGDWLNFLNSKDTFYDDLTLEGIAEKYLNSGAKFVYSDVLLVNDSYPKRHERLYRCNHEKLILNHQASIYKKCLHVEQGLYVVAPRLTISDYLFFSLVAPSSYVKADLPIARYNTSGISQSRRHDDQKFVVDFLLNGKSKCSFLMYFVFYSFYKKIKRALVGGY